MSWSQEEAWDGGGGESGISTVGGAYEREARSLLCRETGSFVASDFCVCACVMYSRVIEEHLTSKERSAAWSPQPASASSIIFPPRLSSLIDAAWSRACQRTLSQGALILKSFGRERLLS